MGWDGIAFWDILGQATHHRRILSSPLFADGLPGSVCERRNLSPTLLARIRSASGLERDIFTTHAHTAILAGGRARHGDQLRHDLSDDTLFLLSTNTTLVTTLFSTGGPARNETDHRAPFFGGSLTSQKVWNGLARIAFFSPRSRSPHQTSLGWRIPIFYLLDSWPTSPMPPTTHNTTTTTNTHTHTPTEGDLVPRAGEAWNSPCS